MADDGDDFDGEEEVRKALDASQDESKVVPFKKAAKPPAAKKKKADPTLKKDVAGRMVRSAPPVLQQLPPDAPVRALGTNGKMVYFLDAHSQLRELAAKDLSRSVILHLFGAETASLYDLWPTLRANQKEQIWEITGWDGTKAQEALMMACARRGIWKPQEAVRGRGAWYLSDGRLALHTGGRIHLSDATWVRPGLVNDMVFPAAPQITEPDLPGDPREGAAEAAELFTLLQSWQWAREVDPRLLLGWIVAGFMGGALKIRPSAWVTGDKGAGKSTLVGEGGLVHLVMGEWLLTTANTTAAGLYQKIGYDSLPVAIDEIEAKRGNEKTEAVIELMRQAYSGGMVLRGGADHEGKEFRARCSVLFGSILIPPLLPQDLSRLALLNLRPLDLGQPEIHLDPVRLRHIGRALIRRILAHWQEWPARFQAWHGYLRGLGHSGRAADQFGTLLAAADMVLSEGIPDEEGMAAIAGDMLPTFLRETQEEGSNASRCVRYAMSRPIHGPRGGEQMLVAELITCAIRRFGGEMENPIKPIDAVRYLERAGVSVVMAKYEKSQGPISLVKPARANPAELSRALDEGLKGDEGVFVAFSPDGDGILDLFRGSDWEGVAGAHNPYLQALERATGARKAPIPVRIGGSIARPVLIPIDECIDVPTKAEAEANAASG